MAQLIINLADEQTWRASRRWSPVKVNRQEAIDGQRSKSGRNREYDKLSRRIADLCEAAFGELQARSFAETPQTAFEKALGASQLEKFARRHEKVFGR